MDWGYVFLWVGWRKIICKLGGRLWNRALSQPNLDVFKFTVFEVNGLTMTFNPLKNHSNNASENDQAHAWLVG